MNLDDRADQLMAMPKYELARFAAKLEGYCEVTADEAKDAYAPDVVTTVTVQVGGVPVEVSVSHDKDEAAEAPAVLTAARDPETVAVLATDEVLAAPAPAAELLADPMVDAGPLASQVVVATSADVGAMTADELRALSKAPGQ